jgi:carbon monoxide dehydrogenase subunit G
MRAGADEKRERRIGYRGGMQRIERSARINAAPDQLFAYLSDLDRLPEWQSGIVAAGRTSPGELTVGSTATVTREMMGQRIEAPLRITEHEPPGRLAAQTEVSGVKALATFDLVAAGDAATDLTLGMEIRGSGFTSFMEPMIASAAKGEIDTSLERLVNRFEQPA